MKIRNVLGICLGLLMFFGCSSKNDTIVIYSCAEDYRNEFYLAELQKKFPDTNFVLYYQGSGAAAADPAPGGNRPGFH